jgi:hypothetical protein
LRTAWTIGLNLHTLLLDVYRNPRLWTTRRLGGTFRGGLPYWSKVEKLTIHRKTDIDPTAANPARHPVSQIDMALSEGLVRKLAQVMDAVPQNEADAASFEAAHSTDAERTAAHATVDAHRDFLMGLVLAQPGIAPITGGSGRDFRVVQELINVTWGSVLIDRNPDDFTD